MLASYSYMPKLKLLTAEPLVPRQADLATLREAAATCKACDLWKLGTQTVFGEGSKQARVMMVGEQPGDKEDLQGRPFVGPAGGVLDKALAAAGIDRNDVYVTNIVKHFREWLQSSIAPFVMATVHPSSILRAPDDESRHEEMRKFIEDLQFVSAQLQQRRAA